MAALYLIRHGQASFGSANYDQLSPLGQRQADVSGQFFADVGLHFAEAVSGDLSRQRETGERVLSSQPSPRRCALIPALTRSTTRVKSPVCCRYCASVIRPSQSESKPAAVTASNTRRLSRRYSMPGSHPIAQTSQIPHPGPTISRALRVLSRTPWRGPRAAPTRPYLLQGGRLPRR